MNHPPLARGTVQELDRAATATNLYVLLNSLNHLFKTDANGYLSPKSFGSKLVLNAGDTIDLVVDFGNGDFSQSKIPRYLGHPSSGTAVADFSVTVSSSEGRRILI